MSFPGNAELQAYVTDARLPSFCTFINTNLENLVKWSTNLTADEPSEIYSIWRSRFALQMRSCNKEHLICKSKTQYITKTWKLLAEGSKTARFARFRYVVDGIAMVESVSSTSNLIVAESILQEQSQPTQQAQQSQPTQQSQQSQQNELQDSSCLDVELFLHNIAHQRVAGISMTEQERMRLSGFTNNGNQKTQLQYIAANLLLKDTLNTEEEYLLELSISSIVNCIHPFFTKFYEEGAFPYSNSTVYELKGGLTDKEETLFDEIVTKTGIDEAISYIQKIKYKLTKMKKRSCRKYVMLSLMEKVLEDMELWDNKEQEQEVTFYRRTASLLDVLFKNTDVLLTDGETASYASKIALEMNKCIFSNADSRTITTYPRKIDLLLEYDRDERIELSSNEWKRAIISPSIALSQQMSNLKVNATIINRNQSVYSSTFNRSLAIDFVGLSGYGYILEKLNDVFFAKMICLLIIPKDFDTFSKFRDTLDFFFKLKDFYCQRTTALKEIISTRRALSRVSSLINISCEENHSTKTNLIFFKQTRKRKRSNSNDDEEKTV